MAKRKKRTKPEPVPADVAVLYVGELACDEFVPNKGWSNGWRILTQVRPSPNLEEVKRRVLRYASKRRRWTLGRIKYRVRAYTRVEEALVEDDDLVRAANEGVTGEPVKA